MANEDIAEQLTYCCKTITIVRVTVWVCVRACIYACVHLCVRVCVGVCVGKCEKRRTRVRQNYGSTLKLQTNLFSYGVGPPLTVTTT